MKNGKATGNDHITKKMIDACEEFGEDRIYLAERTIQVQKNLYVMFIDCKKAFDRVKHEEIIKDLKHLDIDEKERRLLNNLY